MRASAFRSAAKRATTTPVFIPGLMIFSATRRRNGRFCAAGQTTPLPPAPIRARMRCGPRTVPGPSAVGLTPAARVLLLCASLLESMFDSNRVTLGVWARRAWMADSDSGLKWLPPRL